ncbi:ABC transporter ATP-binding protein [Dietzia aurantiaca]|uniref:ABC transporter ATP-binding protein n=1 Tax=Dietzia aurantiaca TaxID=983873 RepID=UPI001E50920C|nr:ABC transporter ATP-binding protein [Dietzia aurantiaca]MCD2262262.1 ABC transporter ATP-binding protein [Dietzia aurantiaca]
MRQENGVRLIADELSCARGKRVIVSGVELDVPPGSRLALVGPNGAGKSTLLRVLAGLDAPVSGSVTVDGMDVHRMRYRRRAQLIAVQGQEEAPSAELTLSEAVALGRTPHRTPWALGEEGEQDIVDQALQAVGLDGRGDQSCTRLSGGERHRVVLARTLAQRTPLLMLDEPTNHLDAAWRLRLMDALDNLQSTVVAAIHDLDLVLRYFDSVAVVDDGRIVAYGPPVETFTADLLNEVFGVHGDIVAHPRTGRPHLLIGDAVTTTESSKHL